MNKQIFKKCPTLGMYHALATPFVKKMAEYKEFYKQHKESIDSELIVYSTVSNDRKKLGGDDKIHKINVDEHT